MPAGVEFTTISQISDMPTDAIESLTHPFALEMAALRYALQELEAEGVVVDSTLDDTAAVGYYGSSNHWLNKLAAKSFLRT